MFNLRFSKHVKLLTHLTPATTISHFSKHHAPPQMKAPCHEDFRHKESVERCRTIDSATTVWSRGEPNKSSTLD